MYCVSGAVAVAACDARRHAQDGGQDGAQDGPGPHTGLRPPGAGRLHAAAAETNTVIHDHHTTF